MKKSPIEDLTIALTHARMGVKALQSALSLSTAVEGRVITDLIGEARQTEDKIDCLLNDAKTDRMTK